LASTPLSPFANIASASDYASVQTSVIELQQYSLPVGGAGAITGDSRVAGLYVPNIGGYPIQNWGFAGSTVSALIDRIDRLKGLRPRFLIGLIGINSINEGLAAPQGREWTNVAGNLARLVSVMQVASPKVCLMTVPGHARQRLSIAMSESEFGLAGEMVNRLNKIIVEQCRSARIPYIDLAGRMNSREGAMRDEFSVDGIHWNATGVEVVRGALAESIALLR
jgi:lysophospholipase L1-like esterase